MVFAATMMIMLGIWQVFVGIAAIANDEFFVTVRNYTYDIDTTAWGWIHLILGALAAIAGFFLFSGATWARWVAIAFAALAIIDNFIFLPYYPLWSLAVIALGVFVIWSLTTVDSRRMAGGETTRAGYYTNERSQPATERWPTNKPSTARRAEPANEATTPSATEVSETPPLGRQ
ncbi:hypothetical protein Prum_060320 [Phytohabitans rumicis]|uniref:DUF7144 domain-containing protein n=1 Tax=Phytohabitans rumicis TaxID=1076125 RepID=A0A6V8L9U5_9ACTN|nr:hypothetical protein Prum_060320 [Phytohabitans rumicis]